MGGSLRQVGGLDVFPVPGGLHGPFLSLFGAVEREEGWLQEGEDVEGESDKDRFIYAIIIKSQQKNFIFFRIIINGIFGQPD